MATCGGCTYAWQIAGGTITSSTTISAITYTPNDDRGDAHRHRARGARLRHHRVEDIRRLVRRRPAADERRGHGHDHSNVNVTWTASAGATSYNVYRSTGRHVPTRWPARRPRHVAFNDGGRSANTAYLYKVRAVNGGESGDSNVDLATTVIFTDDPLVAGTTLVKGTHITNCAPRSTPCVRWPSLGAGSYTDPTLTAGVTPVKAAHVNDLRDGPRCRALGADAHRAQLRRDGHRFDDDHQGRRTSPSSATG